MFGYSRLDDHSKLVEGMAVAVGLDLQLAAQEGRLPPEALGEAVKRCAGCAEPGACRAFLAATSPGAAEAAPDYCRNGDLFGMLGEESTRDA